MSTSRPTGGVLGSQNSSSKLHPNTRGTTKRNPTTKPAAPTRPAPTLSHGSPPQDNIPSLSARAADSQLKSYDSGPGSKNESPRVDTLAVPDSLPPGHRATTSPAPVIALANLTVASGRHSPPADLAGEHTANYNQRFTLPLPRTASSQPQSDDISTPLPSSLPSSPIPSSGSGHFAHGGPSPHLSGRRIARNPSRRGTHGTHSTSTSSSSSSSTTATASTGGGTSGISGNPSPLLTITSSLVSSSHNSSYSSNNPPESPKLHHSPSGSSMSPPSAGTSTNTSHDPASRSRSNSPFAELSDSKHRPTYLSANGGYLGPGSRNVRSSSRSAPDTGDGNIVEWSSGGEDGRVGNSGRPGRYGRVARCPNCQCHVSMSHNVDSTTDSGRSSPSYDSDAFDGALDHGAAGLSSTSSLSSSSTTPSSGFSSIEVTVANMVMSTLAPLVQQALASPSFSLSPSPPSSFISSTSQIPNHSSSVMMSQRGSPPPPLTSITPPQSGSSPPSSKADDVLQKAVNLAVAAALTSLRSGSTTNSNLLSSSASSVPSPSPEWQQYVLASHAARLRAESEVDSLRQALREQVATNRSMYEGYLFQLQQVYNRLKSAEAKETELANELNSTREKLKLQNILGLQRAEDARSARRKFLRIIARLCFGVVLKRNSLHKQLVAAHDQIAVIREYVLGRSGVSSHDFSTQEAAELQERTMKFKSEYEALKSEDSATPRPTAETLVRRLTTCLEELRPHLAKVHTRVQTLVSLNQAFFHRTMSLTSQVETLTSDRSRLSASHSLLKGELDKLRTMAASMGYAFVNTHNPSNSSFNSTSDSSFNMTGNFTLNHSHSMKSLTSASLSGTASSKDMYASTSSPPFSSSSSSSSTGMMLVPLSAIQQQHNLINNQIVSSSPGTVPSTTSSSGATTSAVSPSSYHTRSSKQSSRPDPSYSSSSGASDNAIPYAKFAPVPQELNPFSTYSQSIPPPLSAQRDGWGSVPYVPISGSSAPVVDPQAILARPTFVPLKIVAAPVLFDDSNSSSHSSSNRNLGQTNTPRTVTSRKK